MHWIEEANIWMNAFIPTKHRESDGKNTKISPYDIKVCSNIRSVDSFDLAPCVLYSKWAKWCAFIDIVRLCRYCLTNICGCKSPRLLCVICSSLCSSNHLVLSLVFFWFATYDLPTERRFARVFRAFSFRLYWCSNMIFFSLVYCCVFFFFAFACFLVRTFSQLNNVLPTVRRTDIDE